MKNDDVAYQKALEYLYSYVDFSLQKVTTYSPARFKLERMQSLVNSLGNPHTAYPCIHVAGTKGKGSVSVLCANAMKEAGYKVGLYTSPHLDDYVERIAINGEFIPYADLVQMVEEITPYVEAVPELTTFEITTALALMYFARQKVTAAVIEVGLGGRLDATNVITPVVSIITSISYDHTYLLGETLAEIAGEKAGIIKPGVPVVVSPQEEEARLVIDRIASENNSPLTQVGKDLLFEEHSHTLDGQSLVVWRPGESDKDRLLLTIPLLGSHQVTNAAVAYAALSIFDQKGYKINRDDLIRGFSNAFWPGRFEVVQRKPAVILDCAHNRDSALKLRLTLEEYYPDKRAILIFGASEDKDIAGMFLELLRVVDELILVKSFHPRAIEPSALVKLAEPFDRPVHIVDRVDEAIEKGLQLTGNNEVILVTGSIFVVAEARKYWEKKANIRRY